MTQKKKNQLEVLVEEVNITMQGPVKNSLSGDLVDGKRISRKPIPKAEFTPSKSQASSNRKKRSHESRREEKGDSREIKVRAPQRNKDVRRKRREVFGEEEWNKAERSCNGKRKRDWKASQKEQKEAKNKEKQIKGKREKQLKKHSSPSISNSSDEESIAEEEMTSIMEQVEEKKKVIATIRNKPWPMMKKLEVLSLAIYYLNSVSKGLARANTQLRKKIQALRDTEKTNKSIKASAAMKNLQDTFTSNFKHMNQLQTTEEGNKSESDHQNQSKKKEEGGSRNISSGRGMMLPATLHLAVTRPPGPRSGATPPEKLHPHLQSAGSSPGRGKGNPRQ
ncbi:uncharacterized protein LOC141494037 [Macrotis lagotis]|uniref:uncharacterized protein LOC141494037 n=1 Tax=Macrotis lagotis TaxID=92651 RepID=UPI003D682EE4